MFCLLSAQQSLACTLPAICPAVSPCPLSAALPVDSCLPLVRSVFSHPPSALSLSTAYLPPPPPPPAYLLSFSLVPLYWPVGTSAGSTLQYCQHGLTPSLTPCLWVTHLIETCPVLVEQATWEGCLTRQ